MTIAGLLLTSLIYAYVATGSLMLAAHVLLCGHAKDRRSLGTLIVFPWAPIEHIKPSGHAIRRWFIRFSVIELLLLAAGAGLALAAALKSLT